MTDPRTSIVKGVVGVGEVGPLACRAVCDIVIDIQTCDNYICNPGLSYSIIGARRYA